MPEDTALEISRRDVLKLGAGAVAGAGALAGFNVIPAGAAPGDLNERTGAQMQAAMAAGTLQSIDLVILYLIRLQPLDHKRATGNSIIQVNPDPRPIPPIL